ncbi:hypothetical protein C8R44DRAFT_588105, partial [Mycena epipterygia]
LQNGGVVFDCKDAAMAMWVKAEENMKHFVSALRGDCMYRPQHMEAVTKMVPVEVWITVEMDSGLPEGGIVGMWWIKAENCCSPEQCVMHLKVAFVSTEVANHTIDGNLFFGPKSICIHKSEEE